MTIEWAVRARRGKIFFDYNQNSRGKSLATAFSPATARRRRTVSATVTWEELEKVYPTDFTLLTMPDRLEQRRRSVGRDPRRQTGSPRRRSATEAAG